MSAPYGQGEGATEFKPRAARSGALVLALAACGMMLVAVFPAAARAGEPAAAHASSPLSPSAAHTLRSLFIPAVSADFSRLRPGWRDAALLAGAAGVCGVVAANDLEFQRRITANDSQGQRNAARVLKPLGSEVVLAGGVATWGAAWLSGNRPLFLQVQRADLSVAAAALCTIAVKELVGRKRPDESPNDASSFERFSSHDAFPSGHATLAFAAAAALDRETTSRWVPALGYPLAGLVAWSRLHDRRHWTSDVVAGGAIGFGVAWKAEDIMRPSATGERGASGVSGARFEFDALQGSLAALRLRW